MYKSKTLDKIINTENKNHVKYDAGVYRVECVEFDKKLHWWDFKTDRKKSFLNTLVISDMGMTKNVRMKLYLATKF